MNIPSVKRQDPIGMHYDAPKWIFKRHHRLALAAWRLTLGVFIPLHGWSTLKFWRLNHGLCCLKSVGGWPIVQILFNKLSIWSSVNNKWFTLPNKNTILLRGNNKGRACEEFSVKRPRILVTASLSCLYDYKNVLREYIEIYVTLRSTLSSNMPSVWGDLQSEVVLFLRKPCLRGLVKEKEANWRSFFYRSLSLPEFCVCRWISRLRRHFVFKIRLIRLGFFAKNPQKSCIWTHNPLTLGQES